MRGEMGYGALGIDITCRHDANIMLMKSSIRQTILSIGTSCRLLRARWSLPIILPADTSRAGLPPGGTMRRFKHYMHAMPPYRRYRYFGESSIALAKHATLRLQLRTILSADR